MDKELKHTIDFINQKAGKKTGFSTPDNYFDEIDTTIQNAILNKLTVKTSEEIKEVKIISLYEKTLQFIPIGAVASVLLFIGLFGLNTTKTDTFDDITTADISLWYENGDGITTNEEIAIILDASDFNDTDVLTSINTKNLEDYLNTIDNTTLLNEIQ